MVVMTFNCVRFDYPIVDQSVELEKVQLLNGFQDGRPTLWGKAGEGLVTFSVFTQPSTSVMSVTQDLFYSINATQDHER